MIKFYFICILLLFGGCSLKNPFNDGEILEHKAIVWSQRGNILKDVYIDVTYLNPISSYKDGENFIVGIHTESDQDLFKKEGLNSSKYRLLLDGLEPFEIRRVDSSGKVLDLVPFKKEWAYYYLVKFRPTNGKILKLVFTKIGVGESVLTFVPYKR
jgi:hypothetical protein